MSDSELTRPVLKGEELPKDQLKQYLLDQGLIADLKSPLKIEQFQNGYSNLTYLLQIENKDYVLRRPPFSAPKRGHDMGREYKVLEKLHQEFSKTPGVYSFTEDTAIIGAPFYIMERVKGIILTAKDASDRNIPKEDFQIISDTWLKAFVELHEVDYKAAGLATLGKPEGYVARQVKNWGKQYLAAATEEVISAKKVMQWMEDNQPTTYNYSIIHNDFKYDNVVFKDDNWTNIKAVLDWEMCTLGDPLMDLGTSLAYWITDQDADFMKQGIPSPTVLAGNPSRCDIVQQYARLSGRNIDHLTFYYVYGLFKIAVIAQQIYYRFKHGHTSDPRFARLNEASALSCNMAWQAIQKDQIDHLY